MTGEAPRQRQDGALWVAQNADVEVRFLGRRADTGRASALASAAAGLPVERVAWARQVHSATVLDARNGECGAGDALVSSEPDLALAIATADCVPVLLAGAGEIAAVHAGWRGIVANVLGATLDRLSTPPGAVRAWIGPSIGPCCYQVGEEVAGKIAEAVGGESSALVLRRPGSSRPTVDLQAAARAQLRSRGVKLVSTIATCTRCHPELLWSYRRDGTGAGRNLAFIWRQAR